MLRLRPWALRILRFLDWFTPSVREAWVYGLAALIPLLVLVGERVWVMSRLPSKPHGWDRLWVALGELEFWPVFFAVCLLLGRVPSRWWRGGVRLVMHLLIIPVLAISVAELAFFDITGGRADLDTVIFGIQDFARVWPVVSSELVIRDYVAVVLGVGITLLPVFWTPKSNAKTWLSRFCLLALFPAVYNETQGRVRPAKEAKPLQKTFAESLFWEAMDRRHDVFTPPDPADLAPLVIGAPKRPVNVVIVLLESVGANRTTVYDPELKTTPNLLRMSQEGMYATHMYAAVTHTTKALITTLCGDWPNLVGDARESAPGGLPGRCLADLLREQGYRTGFFQPARQDFEDRVDLVHQMGFDAFRHRDTLAQPIWEKNNYFGLDDRSMLAPGLAWSAEEPERPFFATYLTLASHHDYKLPKHVQRLDFPKVTGRLEQYLNAVRYVDDFAGRLVKAYEAQGLADNTIFVFLGDHGEGFGEHGRYQHDLTIYEEGLHIPLVIWGKPLAGRTGLIEGNRQQIDVLPTILDMVGAPVTAGKTRGSSLLAPVPEGRVLFHSCWRSHRCLAKRDGDQKFIDHYGDPSAQVYDLSKDPTEKKSRTLSKSERESLTSGTRAWHGWVRGRYEAREAQFVQTIQRPDDAPAIATWGGVVSLLGCDVTNQNVIPAEAVWVKCRWRPEAPLTEAWTLIAEIKAGGRTGQEKWTPLMGVVKMWNWRPGWSIDDTFRVATPQYTRPGEAVISVGWQRITGVAVKTDDGRERVDVGAAMIDKRPQQDPAGLEGIALPEPIVYGEEWTLPLLTESGAEANDASDGDLDADPPVVDDRGKAEPEKAPAP